MVSEKGKIDENYLHELIAGGIPKRTNETATDEKEETADKKEWNTRRKKGLPDYSVFLQPNIGMPTQKRKCVYVSQELQETISLITNILGSKKLTIGIYIDHVLNEHLSVYKDTINALLDKNKLTI